MIIMAAYVAGLFLILREAIPWIRAVSSGEIQTRGHRRQTIRRAEDPQRFAAMAKSRFKAMGLGAIVLACAVGWTVWGVLSVILRA